MIAIFAKKREEAIPRAIIFDNPMMLMEPTSPTTDAIPHTGDENEIRALYRAMHDGWNRRNAGDIASLYAADGRTIGFDGSMMNGAAEIESTIGGIFEHHRTGSYVGIVRSVSFPGPGVALLLAIVGMVPPGGSDIKPEVNAIQTLLAVKEEGRWRINLFQNTPAAFHGRPELVEAMTDELRRALHASATEGDH